MDSTVKLQDDVIYLGDNGAAFCGLHAGMTAKYTGRDISGQRVHKVTPEEAAYAEDSEGFVLRCEACGRAASRLYS